jgi:hypothetical protein
MELNQINIGFYVQLIRNKDSTMPVFVIVLCGAKACFPRNLAGLRKRRSGWSSSGRGTVGGVNCCGAVEVRAVFAKEQCGEAGSFVQLTEEQVFGFNFGRGEPAGFETCLEDDAAGFPGVALEHARSGR